MTDFELERVAIPLLPPGETYLGRATLVTERGQGAVDEASTRAGLRTIRLQAVTAALSEAVTKADVVAVILDHAVTDLGAAAGIVVAVAPVGDGLISLGQVGYPSESLDGHASIPAGIATTLLETIRTTAPV